VSTDSERIQYNKDIISIQSCRITKRHKLYWYKIGVYTKIQ